VGANGARADEGGAWREGESGGFSRPRLTRTGRRCRRSVLLLLGARHALSGYGPGSLRDATPVAAPAGRSEGEGGPFQAPRWDPPPPREQQGARDSMVPRY
jgi:hypothetical protein